MIKTYTLFFLMVCCCLSFRAKAQYSPKNENATVTKIIKPPYPNPATSRINFEFQKNNDKHYVLIVYNFLGKKMEEVKDLSYRTELNLDNYYTGIYIYQLRDQNGNIVESGKFNVIKN
ncbi:Por secretion system C-terminal sorting domain-containing protein [Chitinophaga costaii]|uniref:Por secretion system C-terminal sorting domain-containing protein n=1 Tax=Chitinophaga costaii TaxID=1335309 RepID=A0A1C4BZU4_9BACT|nr:T9SS type A sorting domain-containing protein [Chitinophaga costaii]PUZ27405.1 T9SS C-terminal target domain-containing protein [Chitinophaga costaii]SCC12292.1 Por secretion system C-terminal sorting domain-containing protein [Chitinophaga costaii]